MSGRVTIADLFSSSMRRTGIYLLHFPDDDYYVGQAVDVVKRFAQHIRAKGPISGFSFFPARRNALDRLEKNYIAALEHKCSLKNISLVTMPDVETDFDAVMDRQAQLDWLDDAEAVPQHLSYCRNRPSFDRLRRKYADRFAELAAAPYFEDHFLPVMRKYVQKCIPEPFLSEMSFWNCSCLPPYDRNTRIYSRINLRSCEVFTFAYSCREREICCSFHISRSPFPDLTASAFRKFMKLFPSLERSDHFYPSAGSDQWNLCFGRFEDVMKALDHPLFLKAVKTFNLGQMRKGASQSALCRFGGCHFGSYGNKE